MLATNYAASLPLIVVIFFMTVLFQFPVTFENSHMLSLFGRVLLFSNPNELISFTPFQGIALIVVILLYLILTILGMLF